MKAIFPPPPHSQTHTFFKLNPKRLVLKIPYSKLVTRPGYSQNLPRMASLGLERSVTNKSLQPWGGERHRLKPSSTHPESQGQRVFSNHVSEYQALLVIKGKALEGAATEPGGEFLVSSIGPMSLRSTAVSVIRRWYISPPGSRLCLVASTLGVSRGQWKVRGRSSATDYLGASSKSLRSPGFRFII